MITVQHQNYSSIGVVNVGIRHPAAAPPPHAACAPPPIYRELDRATTAMSMAIHRVSKNANDVAHYNFNAH